MVVPGIGMGGRFVAGSGDPFSCQFLLVDERDGDILGEDKKDGVSRVDELFCRRAEDDS
jgi:hypothetical protein